MKIPAKFRLHGCEYRVKVVKRPDWIFDEECVGMFSPQTNAITLLEQTPERLEHAFLHELMHAVLNAMGRDKLYKDEAFVDLIAALLHQALMSK